MRHPLLPPSATASAYSRPSPQQQERDARPPTPPLPTACLNCPTGHPLQFDTSGQMSLRCNRCAEVLPTTAPHYFCILCDYDLCERCAVSASIPLPPAAALEDDQGAEEEDEEQPPFMPAVHWDLNDSDDDDDRASSSSSDDVEDALS